METKNNKEDLKVKFGSDEMIFWRDLIDAKKQDVKLTEQNLKFYKFIVENAEKEFEKAEEKYNKKIGNSSRYSSPKIA